MTQLNPAAELQFVRAGLGELQAYLLSNQLFWNSGQKLQLTLGNLLLAAAYLDGSGQLPAAEKQALAAAKRDWQSAWQQKAEREFASRLRQWSEYLIDLVEKPKKHAHYYASDVRLRVLLELLAAEAPGLATQLGPLDARLKALVEAGEFVWQGEGADKAFPQDEYWFLYCKPDPGNDD